MREHLLSFTITLHHRSSLRLKTYLDATLLAAEKEALPVHFAKSIASVVAFTGPERNEFMPT